jgi:protein-tyrosine phosphatase
VASGYGHRPPLGWRGAAEYRWPVETRLHHIPLMAEAAIIGAAADPARVRQLPAGLEPLYRRMLDTVPQRLASLPGIAAHSGGPVLVYCTAAKDRTGIAIAVLLLVGGVEPADVIADYTASAPNMAKLLRRLEALGRSLPNDMDATSPWLRTPAAAISVVVARLTEWRGGPAGWALAHGASAEDVGRWREQLAGANAHPHPLK